MVCPGSCSLCRCSKRKGVVCRFLSRTDGGTFLRLRVQHNVCNRRQHTFSTAVLHTLCGRHTTGSNNKVSGACAYVGDCVVLLKRRLSLLASLFPSRGAEVSNPKINGGLSREDKQARTTQTESFVYVLYFITNQGDGAFDFLAEEERASKHAKGRLDPGFNEQQMAVLEDTEVLVGQRDAEINNIGMVLMVLISTMYLVPGASKCFTRAGEPATRAVRRRCNLWRIVHVGASRGERQDY